MSEWKEYKIGTIAQESRVLYEPSQKEEVPYVGLEHISQGDLRLIGVGKSTETMSTKKAFKKGDILFGTLRPYFRKVVRPGFDGVCSTDISVLRAKKDNSQEFLFYLIASQPLIDFASVISNGTKMPRAKWKVIAKTEWKLPEPKEQNQIGRILSAYDELIENNMRRIAILEQTAEQIYKEWFVRMRFPGYEKVEFEKGVPKDWEWKKVEEIFKTSSGGTPSRQKEQEYFGGNIDWIKTGELKDSYIFDSEEKITDAGLQNSSAKLFPPDSLLMAMYGVNIGQLGISVKPSTANQAVCVFSPKAPKEYSLYYSYFYFKSIRSHLFNISMGAAQQNLSQDIIKRLNFLKPENNLLSNFNKIQKPLFELILKLSQQNQNLKQTRDLLLPRLISGKLKVAASATFAKDKKQEREKDYA